jgi:hypothetical protein
MRSVEEVVLLPCETPRVVWLAQCVRPYGVRSLIVSEVYRSYNRPRCRS